MALVCILKLNICQAIQGYKLIFVPLCNKTQVKKYKKLWRKQKSIFLTKPFYLVLLNCWEDLLTQAYHTKQDFFFQV